MLPSYRPVKVSTSKLYDNSHVLVVIKRGILVEIVPPNWQSILPCLYYGMLEVLWPHCMWLTASPGTVCHSTLASQHRRDRRSVSKVGETIAIAVVLFVSLINDSYSLVTRLLTEWCHFYVYLALWYSILRETSIDGTGWSPARKLKVSRSVSGHAPQIGAMFDLSCRLLARWLIHRGGNML